MMTNACNNMKSPPAFNVGSQATAPAQGFAQQGSGNFFNGNISNFLSKNGNSTNSNGIQTSNNNGPAAYMKTDDRNTKNANMNANDGYNTFDDNADSPFNDSNVCRDNVKPLFKGNHVSGKSPVNCTGGVVTFGSSAPVIGSNNNNSNTSAKGKQGKTSLMFHEEEKKKRFKMNDDNDDGSSGTGPAASEMQRPFWLLWHTVEWAIKTK
jgi:hypothetical protein